jgi:hypothetical protein
MLYQPYSIVGFHSCDRAVGLKVLNGADDLLPSQNKWDWLGEGIYFWEQNPTRAWEYAVESARKKQFNKIPITTPFVLGAVIDLGKCLNLVDADSLNMLSEAYIGIKEPTIEAGKQMPVNKGNNRELDCAVIQYIHNSNKDEGLPGYDTVRCAFPEGQEVYEGSKITSRLHLQICVRNPDCIKGFFLPRPIKKFNPIL